MQRANSMMIDYLLENGYEIEYNQSEMSIWKRRADPYDESGKFVARPDGMYNYIEVIMGCYDLKKRLSCKNLETASFVMLAYFFASTVSSRDEKDARVQSIRKAIGACLKLALENTSEYEVGQCFLDGICKIAK